MQRKRGEFPGLALRRQIRALVITPRWCETRAAERQHTPPEGRDSPGERKKRLPSLRAQEEHVWEVGRGVLGGLPALAAHPRCPPLLPAGHACVGVTSQHPIFSLVQRPDVLSCLR